MKELHIHIYRHFFRALTCTFACCSFFCVKAQENADSILAGQHPGERSAIKYENEVHQRKTDQRILRAVPDTTVARMKAEKDFEYANDSSYWVKEKIAYTKGFWDYFFDFFESRTTRIIFYLFLIGLAIFVLYRVIVLNNLFIFYASKRQKKVFVEEETSELDRTTIDQKIEEAIVLKEYSNAIRYLYLKTLFALSDDDLIRYHAQGTNSEYLSQMSRHKKIKEFRFLTQVYEYVWYGKFEINDQQFELVYDSFKNFQSGRI